MFKLRMNCCWISHLGRGPWRQEAAACIHVQPPHWRSKYSQSCNYHTQRQLKGKLYNKRPLHPNEKWPWWRKMWSKDGWTSRHAKGQFIYALCTSFLIPVITTTINKHDALINANATRNVRLWCILLPQSRAVSILIPKELQLWFLDCFCPFFWNRFRYRWPKDS